MPATRPSTRIQRRAQPTGSRRQSSRRRTPSTTTTQRQAVSVVSSVEEAPSATTSAEGAHNPSGSLNYATFQRIVSVVSEAVLATIQGTGPSAPPPSSSSAATELVEMPIVESGSPLSQATVPAPVDGNFRMTTVRRAEWMSLINGALLQDHCNEEGFNVKASGDNLKFRIGIAGNTEEDCGTYACDSAIGFGFSAARKLSSGHFHVNAHKAFGYILVQ